MSSSLPIPERHALRLALALLLTASPAFAQTLTIQKSGGSATSAVTVRDAQDFATTVIGDPWDFENKEDYVWMYSNEVGGWAAPLQLVGGALVGQSDANPNTSPWIQIQFEGINGALNLVGRNGVRYPIDPSKYRRLAFRMKRSAPIRTSPSQETIEAQWLMGSCREPACGSGLKLQYIPFDGYFPANQGPNYAVRSPVAENTSASRFHIYLMDLDAPNSPRLAGETWQNRGRVQGLKVRLGEGPTTPGSMANATVELDWVRLVPRDGSTTVTLDWRSFGGAVTLIATHAETGDTVQIFPDDGTSATTFSDNRSFTWDYGFLPPGTWTVTASRGSTTRQVTLTIDPAPVLSVTDPDDAGGRDLAGSVIGDPWDMRNPEDITRYGTAYNIAAQQYGADGLWATNPSGNGDPAIALADDSPRPESAQLRIDGSAYHRLTFTIEHDHKELTGPEALSEWWGNVARVIWRRADNNGGALTNSQDIFVLDGGPHTYTLDLSAMTRFGDQTCPDCTLELYHGTDLWQGPMDLLRIDPHEGRNSRQFRLADVRLAADDEPNASGLFAIRWNVADATFNRGVATSGGTDATVALYWDTDQNAGNGRTLIAQGVAASAGAYLWNTSALPRNTRVWVSIDIADTSGNTQSRYSSGPVAIPATGVPFTDADRDGMDDNWEARYGVSSPTRDEDGDGVNNLDEYRGATSPWVPNRWILAEGNTWLFSERIALANPEADAASGTIQFLRQNEPPVTMGFFVGGYGRTTIDVNAVPGLAGRDVSAVITTTMGAVVAERTMFWGTNAYGGHTGKAVQSPRTVWYLAEGDAGFFSTFILLANPNATQTANVTLEFLLQPLDGRPAEPPIVLPWTVPANQRQTICARDVNVGGRTLAGRAFSTRVTSNVAINVERAMYFGAAPMAPNFWPGGHEAPAVEAPATQWFVAEGTTGHGFSEYLLIANPNSQPTNVTIRYLTPSGDYTPAPLTVDANSRQTVWVNGIPALAGEDVSASISAPLPIIVERAMYWPGVNPAGWIEAHASAGVTSTGAMWALAEGEKGGALSFSTFVLFANPSATAAQVKVTLLRAGGRTELPVFTVNPGTRATRSTADWTQLGNGEKFGVLVESTNGVPIVVERAMYWNGGGVFWGGGSNETAVKIK